MNNKNEINQKPNWQRKIDGFFFSEILIIYHIVYQFFFSFSNQTFSFFSLFFFCPKTHDELI